jgi:hypothetical protein
VAHDGVTLIRLISDAEIVRERNPAPTTYLLEPDFLRSRIGEVIGVPLYRKAALSKDLGKPLPEITIREKDGAQAARS